MKSSTILILGGMAALALFLIRKSTATPAPFPQRDNSGYPNSYTLAADGTVKYTGPDTADAYHPGGQLAL